MAACQVPPPAIFIGDAFATKMSPKRPPKTPKPGLSDRASEQERPANKRRGGDSNPRYRLRGSLLAGSLLGHRLSGGHEDPTRVREPERTTGSARTVGAEHRAGLALEAEGAGGSANRGRALGAAAGRPRMSVAVLSRSRIRPRSREETCAAPAAGSGASHVFHVTLSHAFLMHYVTQDGLNLTD